MADLLFSWQDLESDIIADKIGYLHAQKAPFSTLKVERSPDYIWLVRLRTERMWLMGKLKVTDKKPGNLPKPLKKHFIFYDPASSYFFEDPLAIQSVTEDALNSACRKMRASNMQGAGSLNVFEEPHKRSVELSTSSATMITFDEFAKNLKAGELPHPSYKDLLD